MKRIYIYVPGILTFPGSSKNWDGRAVTRTHTVTDYRAEKVEFFVGVISRAFGQKDRADKLRRTLDYYFGWKIILVGHSNGADVITLCLKSFACPIISQVHLVCGACNADFEKNGLNQELRSNKVEGVTVYCAMKDRALSLAHTLPGKLLGYGTLGLAGPTNVDIGVTSRVRVIQWPNFGHSDCWHDDEFDLTMDNFLKP